MIARDVEEAFRGLLRGFPVVTLTGPRQSGKTTLARAIFAGRPYISLEDPDVRRMALEDPRAFLAGLPDGAVLDEVQRTPELLSYLQARVDADGRMGLFLLTGSQQFGLMSGITQSLAGRSAFIELLPFSLNELGRAGISPPSLDEMLLAGGYPPLYDRSLLPKAWFPAYVTAFVERDVRQILKVQDLEVFQRFVRLCAGRSGQILNLASLATDCGITHNTAKAWISVLEASYVLFLLRPHHENFSKRLIKSPKLYFYDTGLLCWLLGIQNAGQLASHPLRGSIFETFVVSELVKSRLNRGERAAFSFWRDSNGNEIDVVADVGTGMMPIEIKAGQTINRDFFAGLERWTALAGERAVSPALIYGGEENHERRGTRIIGWRKVAETLGG
ncbi:ATPase AAA [Candidatus Desulfobacillus denitrificans]|jgi:predicted AAA+ superfamily ATPase|uniref:ATPase AAA n=2 Tax=Pseudomonadota TaxID=1224 RepID=A0A809QVW7_9PROT|nr:ATPase AAA [Candidatus Desulfobacillus denitrificans]GIK45750.1 MAG: ATPase [Betaproteobacteria bacterium]